MAISDRTRKILWTRSGNKCCLCSANLVTSNKEPFDTTVIGQECHIISEAPKGPRHTIIKDCQYDIEDNIILLCSNCHTKIDTNVSYFTIEKLKELKAKHTEDIRIKLAEKEPDNTFNTVNGVTVLPKINTGKELLNILDNCLGFVHDYEDTSDPEEIGFIVATLDELSAYVDILSMNSISEEIGSKITRIPELNRILLRINEMKFGLFGEKKKKNVTVYNTQQYWTICTVFLMKLDNPNVVPYPI